jgi:hypothetical protein
MVIWVVARMRKEAYQNYRLANVQGLDVRE